MNKLKRAFITMMAVAISCACMLGLTACSKENIVKANFNISIYNYAEEQVEDFALEISLYGHFAPKTVNAVSNYIRNGYYNDTVFYKFANNDYNNQFMIGDLKYNPNNVAENEGFSLNKSMPTPSVEGEFKHGGTTGTDLRHNRGTIGLWRSWLAQDYSYNSGRTGTDSGKATLFLPTARMQAYDDFFCVFATYELNDYNKNILSKLEAMFGSSDNYQEFVIYYTGDYGENGEGLTFNCVKKSAFIENRIEDLFTATDNQLVCYNHYTIKVPMDSDGQVAARITSGQIK